jgi:hypothetical protein
MKEDRYAKYGAATGLVSVILLIVGFFIVTPQPPALDASAEEFSKYFINHQDGIRAGIVISSLALFAFVWFLGSLSQTLRVTAGSPRLPSIAFAGGVLGAAFLGVLLTLFAAAAFRPEETSPELTRAVNDMAVMTAAPAAAGLTALLASTALVILRFRGGMAEWLGWLCAAAAVAQLLPLGIVFTDSGAFAGDGALGLFVPVLSFIVAIACLSVSIMRLPPEGRGIVDRVTGAVSGAASGAAAGAQGRPPK